MKPAFYAGSSGLIASQRLIDNIGNNIANVNTVGFKPHVVTFDSLIRNEMYVNTETDPTHGTGVRAYEYGINSSTGNFISSGVLTDFAIVGEGFFAVEFGEDETLSIEYTRDGNFDIMLVGDNAYLGTLDGGYILDGEGNRIEIPSLETGNSLDLSEIQDSLGVYTFANPDALEPVMSNRYIETVRSGEPAALEDGGRATLQGVLEGANVDLSEEMVNLITAQRAYQFSSRVLQTADENEQTINSLRK